MEEGRDMLYKCFIKTISFDLRNSLGRQAGQVFITLFTDEETKRQKG